MPFDDLDRIAHIADDTTYGLATSIWTRELDIAPRLVPRIKTGTVWISTYKFGNPALAFGGCQQSGWGRETGFEAIELYYRGENGSGGAAMSAVAEHPSNRS